MTPNPDHDSVLHQDATHGGVWRSQAHGMLRQFQRSLHPSFIRRENFRLLRHNILSTAEWQLVLQQRGHKRRAVEWQQIFERFSDAPQSATAQLHLARRWLPAIAALRPFHPALVSSDPGHTGATP